MRSLPRAHPAGVFDMLLAAGRMLSEDKDELVDLAIQNAIGVSQLVVDVQESSSTTLMTTIISVGASLIALAEALHGEEIDLAGISGRLRDLTGVYSRPAVPLPPPRAASSRQGAQREKVVKALSNKAFREVRNDAPEAVMLLVDAALSIVLGRIGPDAVPEMSLFLLGYVAQGGMETHQQYREAWPRRSAGGAAGEGTGHPSGSVPRVFVSAVGRRTLEVPVGDDLNEHARSNRGTLCILDLEGHVLWPEGTRQ